MLEGSRPLLYEYYYPLLFVTKQIKVASGVFACAAMGKITKLKRYAKALHRLTQRQVKKVVLGRWAPCCRNTLQKSNVLFINMSSIQYGDIETFWPLGHILVSGYWNILSSNFIKILTYIKSLC